MAYLINIGSKIHYNKSLYRNQDGIYKYRDIFLSPSRLFNNRIVIVSGERPALNSNRSDVENSKAEMCKTSQTKSRMELSDAAGEEAS